MKAVKTNVENNYDSYKYILRKHDHFERDCVRVIVVACQYNLISTFLFQSAVAMWGTFVLEKDLPCSSEATVVEAQNGHNQDPLGNKSLGKT